MPSTEQQHKNAILDAAALTRALARRDELFAVAALRLGDPEQMAAVLQGWVNELLAQVPAKVACLAWAGMLADCAEPEQVEAALSLMTARAERAPGQWGDYGLDRADSP